MTWKRPNAEKRLLPLLSILDTSKSPSLWIDIGSGDGLFSQMIEKLFPKATVIQCDISTNTNFGSLSIKSYIEKLGIRPKSVNGILCSQVLHYIGYQDQEKVLNELNQFLSPQGIILIIEYILSSRYSWIPFPISQSDLQRYAETSNLWRFKSTKSIKDGSRPKYSLLMEKR